MVTITGKCLTTFATLAVVAITAAGCGTNPHPVPHPFAPPTTAVVASPVTIPPAPTTTEPSLASYGAKYLALVAPRNALVSALGSSPTDAQLTALSNAYVAFDDAVLRVGWPPSVLPDIKALVQANGATAADLSEGNEGSTPQLATDSGRSSADAAIVRADLGLPAAPTS